MEKHKILKTFKGSQTGVFVEEFVEGSVREISYDLAKALEGSGCIEKIIEEAPKTNAEASTEAKPLEEEKAIEEAPDNKAVAAAPSNKKKKAKDSE